MQELVKYLNEKITELNKLSEEVKENSTLEHMIGIFNKAHEQADEDNVYEEPPAELLAEYQREKKRISDDYEEMSGDLDEADENLSTAEKLAYLKQNELRHAQWQYLNLK